MSEFILLFRSTEEQQREAIGSPERAQKMLGVWTQWIHTLETGGHLVQRGKSLQPVGKVVRANHTVTDGPYVEAKDLVLGFIVVRAETLDGAVELAATCPIVVGGGGSVEVRLVWEGMA